MRNWKVHMVFVNNGKEEEATFFGPASRIYEALATAKELVAKEYPKIDTSTMDFDLVMEEGETSDPIWRMSFSTNLS